MVTNGAFLVLHLGTENEEICTCIFLVRRESETWKRNPGSPRRQNPWNGPMVVILSSLCRVSIRKQEKLGQREASAAGRVVELAPVSENGLVKATSFVACSFPPKVLSSSRWQIRLCTCVNQRRRRPKKKPYWYLVDFFHRRKLNDQKPLRESRMSILRDCNIMDNGRKHGVSVPTTSTPNRGGS